MRSATPKVLHQIGGRSLIGHVLHAAADSGAADVAVVVGHGRDEVEPHVSACLPTARTAVQHEQLGTGHAALVGLEAIPADAGTVLVVMGDTPLLHGDLLRRLAEAHAGAVGVVTLLTARLADPTGYGRVLRDGAGAVTGVVEQKDATDAEKRLDEVNTGMYAFDLAWVRAALPRVGRDNAQGEIYLTDVVGLARSEGQGIATVLADDALVTEGVNDRVQLATLAAALNRRTLEEWMRAGVTVVDPASTWVDVTVRLEPDVRLLPGVQLHGATTVATGAVVGPDTTLTDVQVGSGATVVRTHGSDAVLGQGASVGPFAYLRPGTVLEAAGKIGTFVETKNSHIGPQAKVPHLSYIGDADIGEGSNIGAGSITANYDGVAKHRTVVGRHCRTGSDNVFVAPVVVGDGAATGAGAVVRRDVPPGALAVSGGPQRNHEGWTLRKRPDTPGAAAAAAAVAGAAPIRQNGDSSPPSSSEQPDEGSPS
jgi:bifunctional UDP-N-acetylglucosamine pyrophosphorylase/glucosamine-1-phosphate N-acetyltransferase